MTTCERARRLIEAFAVDELSPEDARTLATHVRGCPACSAELGGVTRLLALIRELPEPILAPELDERILVAALADRRRRHDHRSWLADLRVQVLRGAMRTTGTLVATIFTVALLGGAFVFAAAGFIVQTAQNPTPGATVPPEVTPTLAPTPADTAVPTAPPPSGNPTPAVIVATPEPTPAPTPAATQAPEPTPAPSPEPSIVVSSTPEPSPALTPEPTPVPSPTDKRRTPPPSPSPSPTPSESPSPSP